MTVTRAFAAAARRVKAAGFEGATSTRHLHAEPGSAGEVSTPSILVKGPLKCSVNRAL